MLSHIPTIVGATTFFGISYAISSQPLTGGQLFLALVALGRYLWRNRFLDLRMTL
jgi:hypothetical protein